MRKTLLILAICISCSASLFAQAPNIFFELGGPGLASFNFDTRFAKSESGLGGRIGFGGFSIRAGGLERQEFLEDRNCLRDRFRGAEV